MPYAVKRLQDGQTFQFDDPNDVEQLVKSGQGVLASGGAVFNPQDSQLYHFDSPDDATAALKAGGALEGSHEYAKANTGKLESFGRGAAQTLTGGFADEITGALESAAGSLGLTKQDKTYRQARDESRANYHTAEEANPISSLLGSLAGSIPSAAVPGLGVVGKGLSGAVATGAKLGGIYGLGNSEADLTKGNVGGAVKDTLQGVATGGMLGGATNLAGQGLSFVGSKVAAGVKDAVDPSLQRLLALGAKAKDLVDPRNKFVREAVPELEQMGIFARGADGKLPDASELLDRLSFRRKEIIQGMHDAVEAAGGKRLDLGDIISGIRGEVAEVLEKATPGSEGALSDKLDDVLAKVMDTDGDLGALWNLKKNSGGWARWQQLRSSDENKLYQAVNRALGDEVVAATDAVANRMGEGGLGLAELNRKFAAIKNVEDMLAKSKANDQVSSSLLGQKFGDIGNMGLGIGIGSSLGGPVGGLIGGGIAQVGGAALRSTEGRLLRAQVGQTIQQRAAQAQQAVMQGAIPRTVVGVQQWVQQNLPMLAQMAPQLVPIAQRLGTERGAAAEQTVRSMMPILTQFMTPSEYPSELDGKVSEPADKLKAAKQLQSTPGLSNVQLAAKKTALSKSGVLDPVIFAPKQPGSLDDQFNDFSARLTALGY